MGMANDIDVFPGFDADPFDQGVRCFFSFLSPWGHG